MKTAQGRQALRLPRATKALHTARPARSEPAARSARAVLSPYVVEDVAFTREEIYRARDAA
ncbi:MAG: hypothetical protein M0Z46_07645 [Actinomycetota bacterium]|jgi:hypothetical protein|nr:hypothetical protein [Actinomycetota bacterium]